MNVEDEYEIETPATVMGVRGTMFLVGVNSVTGKSKLNVFDGAVATQYSPMRNAGAQEQLVSMGNSIEMPAAPGPARIDMGGIVGGEDPSILANMFTDTIDRMQELQQNEALMASYQNTNNSAYL